MPKTGKRLPPKALEARRKAVVALSAGGVGRVEMAQILGSNPATVDRDLKKPASREELGRLRDQIRTTIMEKTAAGLVDGTLGVVAQAIRDGDAKSLELSTRAATNLEKLTVSASGEAQKVEVTGIPPATHVDLKVLIQQMLERPAVHASLKA